MTVLEEAQYSSAVTVLFSSSFSSLESDLRHLEGLSGLRNLVLDNCRLGDWLILPKMHGLATLRQATIASACTVRDGAVTSRDFAIHVSLRVHQ